MCLKYIKIFDSQVQKKEKQERKMGIVPGQQSEDRFYNEFRTCMNITKFPYL